MFAVVFAVVLVVGVVWHGSIAVPRSCCARVAARGGAAIRTFPTPVHPVHRVHLVHRLRFRVRVVFPMCSVPCACGGTNNNRSLRRSVRSTLPFFVSLESGVPTPPNSSFRRWALATSRNKTNKKKKKQKQKQKRNKQEEKNKKTISAHHHHLGYPWLPLTTQRQQQPCCTYPWAMVQWNLGGVFSTPLASPKCSFPTFLGKNKTRHFRRQSNARICRWAVRPLLVLGCWDC